MDVFSLGNVFYALLTGKMIREHMDSVDEKLEQIINDEPPPIPDYVTDHPSLDVLSAVIQGCWIFDPDERATIFEVVEFLEEGVAAQRKK